MARRRGLADWARQAVNLADARLGARLGRQRQFFAPLRICSTRSRQCLCPAGTTPTAVDGRLGKPRRRRGPGHDWSIIGLARRGRVFGFDVDTSHFTGNYAPAIAIKPPTAPATTRVLARAPVGRRCWPPPACAATATICWRWWTTGVNHLRVHIYPDGGVARLRVYSRPAEITAGPDRLTDLAAQISGDRARWPGTTPTLARRPICWHRGVG